MLLRPPELTEVQNSVVLRLHSGVEKEKPTTPEAAFSGDTYSTEVGTLGVHWVRPAAVVLAVVMDIKGSRVLAFSGCKSTRRCQMRKPRRRKRSGD